MATRLVRANSNTPNVLNSDDSRLLRYACAYNGVTKYYGNECSHAINGSTFKVNSGEIIIDGWQGVIDGAGVDITVVNIAGVQYYKVYAEIDLSDSENQTLTIKASYDTYSYPTITNGDDLTANPSGTARIELYKFTVSLGVISNVVKLFGLSIPGNISHATNADHAEFINGVKIISVDGPGLNRIQMIDPYNTTGYIERKQLIFDGENSQYNYSGRGVWWGPNVSEDPGQGRRTIFLSGTVANGDLIEIIGQLGSGYKPFRAYVKNNSLIISDVSTQDIGPYLIGNQLQIINNSGSFSLNQSGCIQILVNPYEKLTNRDTRYTSMYLWKIFKILGGVV